jgi:hypothetical protein
MALKILGDTLQLYGAASEEGQDILDCMKKLGKLAQPGDVSQSGMMNGLQKMMLNAAQAQKTQQSLGQPGAAGAPPGGGGAPPGAAPPMAA